MSAGLHVFATPALLARGIADAVVAAARDAIAARDRFTIALAGGTTPRDAYALLADEPNRSQVRWDRVRFYFSDERCVPPEDSQSNYHSAAVSLLERIPIDEASVYRMRGEDVPQEAALAYERLLRDTLGAVPQIDLCMLGIGSDGHTASLFPGEDPATDDDALVRAVYSKPAQMWRLTMTPKVINGSREVLFGVSGAAKAEAVRAVREGPRDPVRYPAQIVEPRSGRLLWFVDAAAAGSLQAR